VSFIAVLVVRGAVKRLDCLRDAKNAASLRSAAERLLDDLDRLVHIEYRIAAASLP
jgi:hypothetical protein